MRKKKAKAQQKAAKSRVQFTRRLKDGDARVRQADRLARPFHLLKLLTGNGRWTKDGLAVELECSTKTVERTFKVLELAGIPLILNPKTRTWQIQENCLIPPVKVSEGEYLDEARANAVAKSQAGSKKSQVGFLRAGPFVVPAEVRKIVETASELTSVLELKSVDHSRSTESLRTIQVALAAGRCLEIEYYSPYSSDTRKMVLHPYRLCYIRNAWYLIGRPDTADAPQVFRVVRIRATRATDAPAIIPEEFNLEKFLGNAWGVFRGETSYDIVIRFSGPAADVVSETIWHRTQSAKRNSDGTVTLSFKIDGLDEIVWWLMSWAPFARVEGPKELRERLVAELKSGIRTNA